MPEIEHISRLRWCTDIERVGRYIADCSSVLFRWETDLGNAFVERLDSMRGSNRSRQMSSDAFVPAIGKLKRYEAPGAGLISTALIQASGRTLLSGFHEVL
jgi:hypothetical protein